jgi:uncharacterized protein (DUF433 family)/DNA-binding transcriptional MerR regulator
VNDNRKVIAAFDEDYAVRLTGVSKGQLRHWNGIGFFVPAHDEGRGAFSRIYSFSDIVSLKVLNTLRNQFGVSLQHLRGVKERLESLGVDCWTGAKLYVVNKRVIWQEAGTGIPQEVASGQFIAPVSLDEVLSHTKQDIANLAVRDSHSFGKIKKSRFINHNAPVVSGTRIRVSAIQAFAEAGYSHQQIVDEYPDLTEADVQAALSFKDERAAA